MEEKANMSWHLKKEFSVGHIVSTVMLAGLLIAGWVDVQKRMTVVENHMVSPSHSESERRLDLAETRLARIEVNDAATSERLKELQTQIIRLLDRQDVKLDRIEDRLNKHDMGKDK